VALGTTLSEALATFSAYRRHALVGCRGGDGDTRCPSRMITIDEAWQQGRVSVGYLRPVMMKVVGGLLVVGERSGCRRVEVDDGGTNGVRGRGRRRRGPMRLILTGRESPRTERNHQRGSGIALNLKREKKPKGRYSGGDWLILSRLDA
jgi:hypothetical protein